MPCFQDDFHPDALGDIERQRRAGRLRGLGKLLSLLSGVIDYGMSPMEMPINVIGGVRLFARCAPRMFGVFTIVPPRSRTELPMLRLLAIDDTCAAALVAAANRVVGEEQWAS